MSEDRNETVEGIAAAILALGNDAYTPGPLRDQLAAFRERHQDRLRAFSDELRESFLDVLEELCPGEDFPEIAVRAIAPEFLVAAAIIGRTAPTELGRPFDPARFACAAYSHARFVLEQLAPIEDDADEAPEGSRLQ